MQSNYWDVVRERGRKQITGLSRVTWWRKERLGEVPRRISLGPNSVGWIRGELEGWVLNRAAQRPTATVAEGADVTIAKEPSAVDHSTGKGRASNQQASIVRAQGERDRSDLGRVERVALKEE
jgi:predicted DNA-binding transcriptional regulator AlpA